MPTSEEYVAQAIAWFFGTTLPESTGRRLGAIDHPSIHLGQYVEADGAPVPTSTGLSITPRYALRVGPALPVSRDAVTAPATGSLPDGGPVAHLLWIREVADPRVDDANEIARVMADFDSFATPFGAAQPLAAPSTPGVAPDGATAAARGGAIARAAEWAAAIVTARHSLPTDLAMLTAVPQPLQPVAADVDTLRSVLMRYCTYTAQGASYARWTGGGRDATNPAHLTDAYKQHNALEVQLDREQIYLYAVVPESLLTRAGDLGGGLFREVVIRFDPTGQSAQPFTLATVHTARWRRNAALHADFVFFYTTVGSGIAAPRAVRAQMSPSVQQFLDQLDGAGDAAQAFLEASSTTVAAGNDVGVQLVPLVVLVDGRTNPLPADIAVSGEPPALVAMVPSERVAEIAATPGVRLVDLVPEPELANDLARAAVRVDRLTAKLPAAKRGGKGVVIGIIDSGIDGSHPAFAGRLHAVWDQQTPPVLAGQQTPFQRHPANAAYSTFNFGVELEGATGTARVGLAQDVNGHGTHVAGIAAGQETKDGGVVTCPAGVAPLATIVAVRAIGVPGGNWVLGVQWVAQKARELNMPYVINMSFEHHQHGHDGSDTSSLQLFGLLTDARTKAYRPGRVVVAAAGNKRAARIHIRRQLARMSAVTVLGTVQLGRKRRSEALEIWIRNPTGASAASFPLVLFLRRLAFPGTPDVTPGTTLPGTTTTAFALSRTQIRVASAIASAVNGDFLFRVGFDATGPDPAGADPTPSMKPEPWEVIAVNASPHDLDVHAWITYSPNYARGETPSTWVGALSADDAAYVVGAPAAGAAAISVASSNSRLTYATVSGPKNATTMGSLGDISSFSSNGPLRQSSIPPRTFYGAAHEINGVDVTAPGAVLRSALSTSATADPDTTVPPAAVGGVARSQMMQGTSMAAPVVTGLVATILAAEPTLTLPQVLARLKAASVIPTATAHPAPRAPAGAKSLSSDWGYGLIDANLLK